MLSFELRAKRGVRSIQIDRLLLLVDDVLVEVLVGVLAVVASWVTNTAGRTIHTETTASSERMNAKLRCQVAQPKRFAQVELCLKDESSDCFVFSEKRGSGDDAYR